MKKETKRQIGIACSLLMYFIYALLLTIRTKVLIHTYGSEVNAVFQTSNQIFAYLILFESGISAAYQFKLYAPVNERDVAKVYSLFMGLKRSMQKIAFKMMAALLVVAILYPVIMDRITISFIKAGLMLLLLGLRFVIPYFVSLTSKTLLNVYDYKYIVDNIDSLGYIVITVVEILIAVWFRSSVYIVLVIGCIGNIIVGVIYSVLVKKFCGIVQKETVVPDFGPEEMTKDILLHHITGLFNSNIDTIILSIVNIMSVTPYHAYYSTMNYFPQAINKINENYRTKIGMKIKNRDPDLYDYFQIIMAFHMAVAITTVTIFILNINNFIGLWIGKEYILSNRCVFLLSLYLMHKMIINNIFLVRDGAGLYRESKWFSLAEGIANLVLSIILVQYWGIEGILFATVFATFTMLVPGNARLAYNKVMGKKNTLWVDYLIIIAVVGIYISVFSRSGNMGEDISWNILIIRLLVQTSLCGVGATLTVALVKWRHISQILIKKR